MDERDRARVELAADMMGWIQLLKMSQADIKALEEKVATAREKIQEALGDNEVGLIDGSPVVRWTKVTSTRLDMKKAKEVLDPKVLAFLSSESTSRRFTLVDTDELH
jgi:predicted phage-related endonuclease